MRIPSYEERLKQVGSRYELSKQLHEAQRLECVLKRKLNQVGGHFEHQFMPLAIKKQLNPIATNRYNAAKLVSAKLARNYNKLCSMLRRGEPLV